MRCYVTAVGSGYSLNFPHQKEYGGVLALAERAKEFGLHYKTQNGVEQDKIFHSKYQGTNYTYLKLLEVNCLDTVYQIGSKIVTEMDLIKKEHPKVTFHFEISAGYKRIGSILTLITYIRSSDIEKLTFLNFNGIQEQLPIIKIDLHSKEREILEGYREAIHPDWNGKINMNPYVLTYPKDKKYVYKVINKCKKMGIVSDNNRLTDFGELYLDYC
ncbi:MAG: hypothetical protein ACLFPL_05585 [Candidatus Nanoarchaeia archaeon]